MNVDIPTHNTIKYQIEDMTRKRFINIYSDIDMLYQEIDKLKEEIKLLKIHVQGKGSDRDARASLNTKLKT